MYHTYDPTNHFQTTAQKVHIMPDARRTNKDTKKNNEFRKFAQMKNLNSSFVKDVEEEKRSMLEQYYVTNIEKTEAAAKDRKVFIRN